MRPQNAREKRKQNLLTPTEAMCILTGQWHEFISLQGCSHFQHHVVPSSHHLRESVKHQSTHVASLVHKDAELSLETTGKRLVEPQLEKAASGSTLLISEAPGPTARLVVVL